MKCIERVVSVATIIFVISDSAISTGALFRQLHQSLGKQLCDTQNSGGFFIYVGNGCNNNQQLPNPRAPNRQERLNGRPPHRFNNGWQGNPNRHPGPNPFWQRHHNQRHWSDRYPQQNFDQGAPDVYPNQQHHNRQPFNNYPQQGINQQPQNNFNQQQGISGQANNNSNPQRGPSGQSNSQHESAGQSNGNVNVQQSSNNQPNTNLNLPVGSNTQERPKEGSSGQPSVIINPQHTSTTRPLANPLQNAVENNAGQQNPIADSQNNSNAHHVVSQNTSNTNDLQAKIESIFLPDGALTPINQETIGNSNSGIKNATLSTEQRGNFNQTATGKGQTSNPIDNTETEMMDLANILGGPDLILSAQNETKYVGENFIVLCTNPSGASVMWVHPNGVALTRESKPSVTTGGPGISAITFFMVRVEDAGIYSCTSGLKQAKYQLTVDDTPVVLPSLDGRRVM